MPEKVSCFPVSFLFLPIRLPLVPSLIPICPVQTVIIQHHYHGPGHQPASAPTSQLVNSSPSLPPSTPEYNLRTSKKISARDLHHGMPSGARFKYTQAQFLKGVSSIQPFIRTELQFFKLMI